MQAKVTKSVATSTLNLSPKKNSVEFIKKFSQSYQALKTKTKIVELNLN
jgi:hypothetical protein